jgi:hypothetical protein
MTPKLEELSVEQLKELIELKSMMEDVKSEDMLARLLEQCTLIEAKKRRGKTLTAVAFSYQIRERFGRHVIAVGTKMGLKPEFGTYQTMSEVQFRDALEKIQDVVDEEEAAEDVVKALREKGVDLMYALLVFDEAFKLFDSRSPSDKLVKLCGYFMAQQAHYHCTTILLAPDRDMIDKRVRRQVDWFGRVYHNKWSHDCTVRLTAGLDVMTIPFNGADDTNHVPYYQMYDTYTLVGYRRSQLDIEGM